MINNNDDDKVPVNRALITAFLGMGPAEWDRLNSDYDFRRRLDASCRELMEMAYARKDRAALAQLHATLALLYEQDFAVAQIDRVDCEMQPIFRDIAARLERAALDDELQSIPDDMVKSYPERGSEYVAWLKDIIVKHHAASHPLYRVFLSEHATREDIRFYLAQETNLDPRFDDILALVQVGTRGGEKMEIAGNFWDELGNGNPSAVHTALFAKCLEEMDVNDEFVGRNLLLEAQLCGNLSSALTLSRRHYYKSIGFLAVTEYLVPRRFKSFVSGWRRNGLREEAITYHNLHIEIDASHAAGWFKNIVAPLIDRDPRTGREIALGALIRLNSSARYLDALMAHFERPSRNNERSEKLTLHGARPRPAPVDTTYASAQLG